MKKLDADKIKKEIKIKVNLDCDVWFYSFIGDNVDMVVLGIETVINEKQFKLLNKYFKQYGYFLNSIYPSFLNSISPTNNKIKLEYKFKR